MIWPNYLILSSEVNHILKSHALILYHDPTVTGISLVTANSVTVLESHNIIGKNCMGVHMHSNRILNIELVDTEPKILQYSIKGKIYIDIQVV